MSKERWRDIDGFENYRVSSEGRVRNKRTGRVLRSAPDSSGYMTVGLSSHGKTHSKNVHRLVAKAFLDKREPEAYQVNHIDGNKHNNTLDNLEWVSPSENMAHAYSHGLNHWVGYNETPIRIVETGEVFKSQAECARAINGIQANINACLAGRRHTHLGYHYEYAE